MSIKPSQRITDILHYLTDSDSQHLLGSGLKGIEKESLRISKHGFIAQTPHPQGLGSALTHPYITTDYSEALLEFITPPFADIKQTLNFMQQIHQFVYQHLDDEILLATSMPCGIDGDDSIPIADYGKSNIGQMKHVYRRGLWHRYGRTMQAIAGIHFNYSVPTALWPLLHQYQNSSLKLEDFIADAYFGMIRNIHRQGWLILYLFGASPAICKAFFKSRPQLMTQFEGFDSCTLYHPYATSLRMSDIGYKSKSQATLKINCNSLNGYVDSLTAAINTPYPDYEKIGVKISGQYQQLNANILQIENEFYSTVRPKQIANSGEKPTLALKRRGVRYVELRSLDLNLFDPLGIDESKARFIEVFLLSCLLKESPLQENGEQPINNSNQLLVANQGRKPGLQLNQHGQSVSLQEWAEQILADIEPLCELLDTQHPEKPYMMALQIQQQRILNPDLTPSAQLLAQMSDSGQAFGAFGLQASLNHAAYFKNLPSLAETVQQEFELAALESHQKQQQIEAQDRLNFDDFLLHYFAQH